MSHADAAIRIRPGGKLAGSVGVPGDKSISHRALILGALADGTSRIRHFLPAGDTRATLDCVRALGVTVEQHDDTTLTIHGRGLHGLQAPSTTLNCVNAGTGIRLLAGVMAGQPFASVLDGSEQLRRRPMGRITAPLRQMGANIEDDGHAPLYFRPSRLHGITCEMPVASAQVKSCLLLAGLFADRPTAIIEPGPARDHTERMLHAMGAGVQVCGGQVTITPADSLRPLDLTIPGDISSAAFILAAAAFAAAGSVTIQGVGVNPTRTGILDILAAMGAEIEQTNPRDEGGEPVADLVVQRGTLRGTNIGGDWVVRAIDEFPALMAAAAQAEGETIVTDAAELRVKETDRIAVMAGELRKLGAEIEERADGFRVVGPQKLRGAVVEGHDDHRVAMALAVAGLAAEGETFIHDAACVNDSFPGFVETLQSLGADMEWVDYD
jgi:3-phosphoshikimate 1-carboxyvinyltransferase